MQAQQDELTEYGKRAGSNPPTFTPLSNGGVLVEIENVDISGQGWNRDKVKLLFVIPAGYPASQPDCFWVEPAGFRMANGGTPQNTNDANPIPGDVNPGRLTTWFSWHLQTWNPSKDSLVTYFNVIMRRFSPAR